MYNAVAIDSIGPEGHSSLISWSAASLLGVAVVGAGLSSSVPVPVVVCAAAFLFFAVASDVRSFRVPNLLTFPALLGALILSPMMGGTSGPMEAALGAALGFGLLVGPYALGGFGAGDVKALMALGAWLGPQTTLGATVWALIAAAGLGLILLAFRGELVGFARRWGRNLFSTLVLRRIAYEAPSAESSTPRGIPFAVALAVGLSIQWFGGSPW